MKKIPIDVPSTSVISNTWKTLTIKTFLQRLNKGSIFGYSDAFSYDTIVHLAKVCGVTVSTLPFKSPLYKKYGVYVLRVVSPFDPTIFVRHNSWHTASTSLENIKGWCVTTTRGNRKCRNKDCEGTIYKGDPVMEITLLVELFNGYKGYKKESYHPLCAAHLIKRKIASLLNMMPVNEKVRNKNSKIVKSLIDEVYHIC